MYTMEGKLNRIVVIRLEAGEDLLEGLEKGVKEKKSSTVRFSASWAQYQAIIFTQ